MPLPTEPTQWTVTLTPAPAAASQSLRARARRWGLTAIALLAAYWIGTASAAGGTPPPPPRPAHTQSANVHTPPPHR
ncbi:hypothetical protein [Streptomyces platensis]|uniref:hypothetical protein n=1 Tax=Streptomyces platensis TaxID=58346 RepID=UPI00379DD6BF